MAYLDTFPIDVDARNVQVDPSSLSGCVNLQADVNLGDVDSFLDNLDKQDIISYMECQDYTVVKNDSLDDILTGMDFDKVLEFVESQGFKLVEE